MSSMKNSDIAQWIVAITLISFVMLCFTALVIDAAYHHYQEEHARPASKGWQPPKIVRHENCSTWDEIRKACEDD